MLVFSSLRHTRPQTSYTYNPDGYRSSKTVDGIRTNHIWNGTQIVLGTDETDTPIAEYIYGVKRIYNEQNGEKTYYLYDAHGDTKQLTDSLGDVTWDYTYDAFGNEISLNDSDTDIEVDSEKLIIDNEINFKDFNFDKEVNSEKLIIDNEINFKDFNFDKEINSEKLIIDNEIDFRIFITDNEADNGNSDTDNETAVEEPYNPFRYCGEYFDEETGFIYLRARYYDPEIGRFISEDTHWNIDNLIYGDREYKDDEIKIPDINAILQSGSLYVYCMNSPIENIDLDGELAFPGEIHNLVVDHVAYNYGFYKEQKINYGFLWGRADLISADGQVWDVKRNKPNQIKSGVEQVKKYTENEWSKFPDVNLSVGGYIESSSFIATMNFDTYYVDYEYVGDGVIAYDYDKVTNWGKVVETAGVLVITAASIALAALSNGAINLPYPVLS